MAPQTVPATVPPPPTTTPAPARVTVPAGFGPVAVTFVSPDDGWALGRSAATPGCAVLAKTSDGGRTWSQVPGPSIPDACSTNDFGGFPGFEVRFADRADGWVYTAPGASELPSRLWSTHDGGKTWSQLDVPIVGGTIGDLEAAAGQVSMVVYGPCPSGSAGCQGQTQEEILSSPVGSDQWVPSPIQPALGGGPALVPQITLWGPYGWLVNNNRTVVSGARLTPASGWAGWTPPCSTAGGQGVLAASSASDIFAVCAEGMWGTPDKGTVSSHNWLFHSTDGGKSFSAVGPVPGNNPLSFTVAPGADRTMVLDDGALGLQASFDGGRLWTTVEAGVGTSGSAVGGGWFGYVGFTTATQGVAIRYQPEATLFMTRDGGHTWSPVQF
jgi:photosystem II stability/assembly factor-like uncharacterized protein